MRPVKRSLPIGNKTIIGQCIDAIIGSGIGDTVIVVNQQAAGSLKGFKDLPVRFAVTPGSGSETAESVKTGLRALGDSASGVLLCLADHPLTSIKTIRTLALEHYAFCNRIIIPAYRGQRGYPALFPRHIINEVLSGMTLLDIIRKDPRRVRQIDVRDEGVIFDMDAPVDYDEMMSRAGIQGTS